MAAAEGADLRQVSAGRHSAPLAAVISRRVVEVEDAVGIAAAADQLRSGTEKIGRGLGDAAEKRDRASRARNEAGAKAAAVALEAQAAVVLGQDEVDRRQAL